MAKISLKMQYLKNQKTQRAGRRTKFDPLKISTELAYIEATKAWNAAIEAVDQHARVCPQVPKEGREDLCAVCNIRWRDETKARLHWQSFGHPLPVGGL